MRQYLYLFCGLVLAGMIILTAASPACRQAAVLQYPANLDYAVIDQNGVRIVVRGGELGAQMSAPGRHSPVKRIKSTPVRMVTTKRKML